MKVMNENPHSVTLLSEDGNSIHVNPGVHPNIHKKFAWNMPSRVRDLSKGTRMAVSTGQRHPDKTKVPEANKQPPAPTKA